MNRLSGPVESALYLVPLEEVFEGLLCLRTEGSANFALQRSSANRIPGAGTSELVEGRVTAHQHTVRVFPAGIGQHNLMAVTDYVRMVIAGVCKMGKTLNCVEIVVSQFFTLDNAPVFVHVLFKIVASIQLLGSSQFIECVVNTAFALQYSAAFVVPAKALGVDPDGSFRIQSVSTILGNDPRYPLSSWVKRCPQLMRGYLEGCDASGGFSVRPEGFDENIFG
ncbi:MAG: hypothetical protein ABIU97_00315 [Dehalococcoidia bacterium]